MKVKVLVSCVRVFVTPWTIACQAPLSMELSWQRNGGLPFPSPGDVPYPGIQRGSLALQAYSLPFEPPGKPSSCIWIFNSFRTTFWKTIFSVELSLILVKKIAIYMSAGLFLDSVLFCFCICVFSCQCHITFINVTCIHFENSVTLLFLKLFWLIILDFL